jgi:hypothetical protein
VDTTVGGLCLPTAQLCPDRKDFVFWDAYHTSDSANQIIADRLFADMVGSGAVVPGNGTTAPRVADAPVRTRAVPRVDVTKPEAGTRRHYAVQAEAARAVTTPSKPTRAVPRVVTARRRNRIMRP